MPYDLRDIAAIAGMSGLYRLVKPTRTGVIVESLEENPNRIVAQARHRISLLHEISIYTNDTEYTVPLAEVFDRIHQKFGNNLPVTAKSTSDDLSMFIEEIIPDYDRERVYTSDIKKLVTWYGIVSQFVPYTEATEEEATVNAESEKEADKE
ncbi:MAG: DUF5606 domain-containing protein [Hymenobacteraceae bacterium]|nr:DUF5606 domain-containing protein [Hymenobacteraceae bacterium]MDX5396553.1 DUF5606 domain-containing protein [Hymenobacteraceae bacterium]MDX5443773.1 DUF5606 domain-containing protein [Hymenobacteraceae bacterium]MDX5512617.1 DUF5606 domain-containing protein [Hymenobacteraceae bacterium]